MARLKNERTTGDWPQLGLEVGPVTDPKKRALAQTLYDGGPTDIATSDLLPAGELACLPPAYTTRPCSVCG